MRPPRHARRASVLLAVGALLLAACATGPRPIPDERSTAWSELEQELQALNAWRAEGRLVVRTDGDGTPASFTWIERPDGRFELRLSGPWGQGAARLSGGAGLAELVTADGMRYIARDAGRLLSDIYGWSIPVAGLRRWMLGLPGPEAEYTLDRFGRLEALDWHDWHIDYGRYRLVDEGLDLPAVLTAARTDGSTEVRVAIQSWHLQPADRERPRPDAPIPLMGRAR